MSMMSDSQDATDFSSTQFNISEDSNSEPPFKKKLMEGWGECWMCSQIEGGGK